MKIRNGFVSNSSSSSFMIGIGIIEDEKKLEKYLKENNLELGTSRWDDKLHVNTIAELQEIAKERYSEVGASDVVIYLNAPVNSSPSVSLDIAKLDPSTKVLHYCTGNDEGDSAFMCRESDGDIWGYCDYDQVDYEWFNAEQKKCYDAFDIDGMTNSQTHLGADRNG